MGRKVGMGTLRTWRQAGVEWGLVMEKAWDSEPLPPPPTLWKWGRGLHRAWTDPSSSPEKDPKEH